MIEGSFSLGTSVNHLGERFINGTAARETVFHPVGNGIFKGGFFLHPRLPDKPADIYFSDEENDITVLFSGSVYNNYELFEKYNIKAPVHNPELITLMFLQDGPYFVEKLNGDFVIFIGQPGVKHAYLFRDHIGIRPLAWIIEGSTLFFSSDSIGLCQAFADGKAITRDYLLGYFKYIDYRITPEEKVEKLLPGHFLHFSDKGGTLTGYWKPEKIKTDRKLTPERIFFDLKNIVHDAVKIRCDHRFTAGAHVSSGIDSGIVSVLARNEFREQSDFFGFSWSPREFVSLNAKYDERELVEKLCEKTKIKPVFSEMNLIDFQKIVKSFFSNKGFFSEDNTVEQAIEFKTNLIFSGWGGDEFISSGDRGIEQDLLFGLRLRKFFRRNPVKNRKVFIRNQLVYVIYPLLGVLDRRTARSFRDNARYIKKPYKKSDRRALRNFHFHTSRRQLHLRLLQFYHLQERCESWYLNGAGKGVEYRYPLLDKRIIEYMLKVPSEMLCNTGSFRPLLREIAKGIVPDEVRLINYKSDPVYWSWMEELFKKSASIVLNEIDIWKDNPDLYFIDFKLLAEDIDKYKSTSGKVDQKILFRALVYIKAIHEFTRKYRGKTI